jgi:hypothetical protein
MILLCYLEEIETDVAGTELQPNRPRINQIHKEWILQSEMILLILLLKTFSAMKLPQILTQAI